MNYLYEPNASVMKAGCFTELEEHFGICSLSPNSHLYLAENLIADFPGRAFMVDQMVSVKEAQRILKGCKANVSCRNFPMKPEELKRKLGVSDGGDVYVFGTKTASGTCVVMIARKFTIE